MFLMKVVHFNDRMSWRLISRRPYLSAAPLLLVHTLYYTIPFVPGEKTGQTRSGGYLGETKNSTDRIDK